MAASTPLIREATRADVPALFMVRTRVEENHMSREQLAEIGITPATIASMIDSGDAGAWCAEIAGEVIGFSMARTTERDVFALFVLPAFERRGAGSALLERAVEWLWSHDRAPVQLSTGRDTRALAFYRRRGWREIEGGIGDDAVLELVPA